MPDIQTALLKGIQVAFLMCLSLSPTTPYSWSSYQNNYGGNFWPSSNNWYDEQLSNSINKKPEKDICQEQEMDNSINSRITEDSQYCKLCSNGDHTMCKYGNGPGYKCGQAGEGGVTDEQIQEILDAHNDHRRKVASGNESRGKPGPQPAASDMMLMTWDENLARVAQRWADQCTFGHDTCRDDPRGEVGQNVYVQMKYPDHRDVNWTHAVGSWYNEVDLFNNTGVPHYSFDSKTGHYTQVVWATSARVGCGLRGYGAQPNAISFDPKNPLHKLYVCNYYPSGNWDGDPIYNINDNPCDNCPNGTYCDKSLCACGSGGKIYTPRVGQSRTTESPARVTPTRRPKSDKTRRPRPPTTTPSTTTLGNDIYPLRTTTESLIELLKRLFAGHGLNSNNFRIVRYYY